MNIKGILILEHELDSLAQDMDQWWALVNTHLDSVKVGRISCLAERL
jgi:hypothetical protein